jgi:hypothetical protein
MTIPEQMRHVANMLRMAGLEVACAELSFESLNDIPDERPAEKARLWVYPKGDSFIGSATVWFYANRPVRVSDGASQRSARTLVDVVVGIFNASTYGAHGHAHP